MGDKARPRKWFKNVVTLVIYTAGQPLEVKQDENLDDTLDQRDAGDVADTVAAILDSSPTGIYEPLSSLSIASYQVFAQEVVDVVLKDDNDPVEQVDLDQNGEEHEERDEEEGEEASDIETVDLTWDKPSSTRW